MSFGYFGPQAIQIVDISNVKAELFQAKSYSYEVIVCQMRPGFAVPVWRAAYADNNKFLQLLLLQ